MYNFKRWMVGLDNSLMDRILIKYVSFLADVLKPDKIYFIHIHKELDVPEEIKGNFPELRKPIDERLEEEIRQTVTDNFAKAGDFDIDFRIDDGDPFKEILNWSHNKNIDLLLVGRKRELRGGGILPQKLARKVPCSVLFVPERPSNKLEDLLVATDFSDTSKLALEMAVNISSHNENNSVHCYHTYQLPTGYYSTGKTAEEFALIMKENCGDRYNKFINDLPDNRAHLSPIFEWDKDGEPSTLINKIAHKKNADLIVIGARGRTSLTSFLLGSITEALIGKDDDIPLLVVKEKDKSLNFLDLMKTI